MISHIKDSTPTLLFNPDKKDFTYPMSDDDNVIHHYTLPSRKVVSFPKYIATHLAKHLAQKLAQERTTIMTENGPLNLHFEERMKQELDRIYKLKL